MKRTTFQQGDETQAERFWWMLENWRTLRESRKLVDGKPLPTKWDVPLIHVGDWHKQPGFMIQPSTGDLMTARIMLEDPEANMEFLIAPILTIGHPTGQETPPGTRPGKRLRRRRISSPSRRRTARVCGLTSGIWIATAMTSR